MIVMVLVHDFRIFYPNLFIDWKIFLIALFKPCGEKATNLGKKLLINLTSP